MSAVVSVKLVEQLLDFRSRHVHLEVTKSILEFLAVNCAASVVVDHPKRSGTSITTPYEL